MAEHQHCQEFLGTLSEYIDGTLQQELCAELERHMADCDNCQIVVNTIRKTIELYQETSKAGEDLPEEVRQRLFYRLELAEFIAKASPPQ
jgi:anti-sigma factor RsiW